MTSSGQHRDHIRERSTTMQRVAARSKKSIRLAILVAGLSLGSIGGFAGSTVAAPVLVPMEDTGGPGGGGGSAGASLEWTFELPYEQGRPVLVEQSPAQGQREVFHAPESVQTTINGVEQLASADESLNGVEHASSADESLPDFVVHPNLRSIQLIESKEAAIETAQPASSNGYSICLSCLSLG